MSRSSEAYKHVGEKYQNFRAAQDPRTNPPINDSGIDPVEYKVLIRQDRIEEVTKGGIVLPGQVTEKEQWAQTRATLVAAGGNAFSDWKGRIPVPGERVIVKQYAGYTVDGKDGEKYQVCNDRDISAIVDW